MKKGKLLVIAGGGTGGHVLAGVAVAEQWLKANPDAAVSFVGSRGGIEENLVPKAGYPLHLLRIGSLKGVAFRKRFKTAVQIPIALLTSLGWLLSWRPAVVLGVGGYASGPFVLMARVLGWLWGCKTAVIEQNSVPGLTNRLLGKLAHRVFTAFPGMENVFSPRKVIYTGNPVRSSMKPLPPASGDRPFTVFVFGGSQGAVGINTLVIDALSHLQDLLPERISFVHQTGKSDYERVRSAHEAARSGSRVEAFVYDMPETYEKSSLLICRAGSSTLAEIAAVGRASILIPFPFASDNHQEKNARIFEEKGAARVLVQSETSGKELAALIRHFVENPQELRQIEERVKAFYRPEAAQDVVRAISY